MAVNRRTTFQKRRWPCQACHLVEYVTKDEFSSDFLLTKLGIQDYDVVLGTSRMRWFGHVERSVAQAGSQ